MINTILNLFKQESYSSTPEEWKNNENTVFREFYLESSPDFDILYELVRDHMSDKGNEGVTRYRLMCLLRSCSHRAFYLRIQERKYPHTWRIRWKWRRFRLFLHRRFKTCYFRKQVKLCNVASEVIKGFEARLLYADEYKTQQ